MITILLAAVDTDTTVVAGTITIQMTLATKNKGSDANGSNSKGPNAHCGSGVIGGGRRAGGVHGNGGTNVFSGSGSGDCLICGR